MKKTFALVLFVLSFNVFAANNYLCTNDHGDTIEGSLVIQSEEQTNGTWTYFSAHGNFDYEINGRKGKIEKSTVLVLAEGGWEVMVYKILYGNSETIELKKVNYDITGRYVDKYVERFFTCTEIAI